MSADATDSSSKLNIVLALALDAGRTAEDHLETIVAPRPLAKSRRWDVLGDLAARTQRRQQRSPSADQVRRACAEIDEFSRTIRSLAERVDERELERILSLAESWSNRLWDSNKNATGIYGEMRSAMAVLNRCRTNLILNRPFAEGLDRDPP